jgi:protein-S-isoprenylcysteine O-methyltransferase Ste14
VQKALYGALFVVVVPAMLGLWARAAGPAMELRAVHSVAGGGAVLTIGMLLLLAGIGELMVRGKGLPMNAFPPPEFVRSGVYRWLRNPIYIGFGLICAGASIATGSAAGLWLVTPITCLAMLALVHGYEGHDLKARFGAEALRPPLLSIPRGGGAPTLAERAAVCAWILLPWLALYFAVQALGRAPDVFGTDLPFERRWPVMQWTELFYFSTYLFVPLVPFIAQHRGALRGFAVRGAVAIVIVNLIWITVPVVAVNRPFVPAHALGRLLAWEQGNSQGVAAFPAFHVLWTLLAADALSANTRGLSRRAWRWIAWIWALLITLSCLTTGMHSVIEVAAALALWIPLRNLSAVWEGVRRATERLANSWREWHVGPVRIINHGAWAAAGGGTGLLVAGCAVGHGAVGAAFWVSVCVVVGAGLWAQLVEGSSRLLRPFGWYGGLIGGTIGVFTARAWGTATFPLLAAFAIASPWIQILGRMRCLVQGCCHGGPTRPEVGISYRHPRSRVTQLANLAGIPIHATPLYSIAGNLIIGVLLVRLRVLAAPDSLVVGVYLMLSGIARFVEESFRAEPQTPTIAGLHSYQWLAIACLLAGMLSTAIPAGPGPAGFDAPAPPLLWAALAMALITGFAMGVDFPASNRRFSRLAAGD